jgi:hypothetical protein
MILVCRKRAAVTTLNSSVDELVANAEREALSQLQRLRRSKRRVSRNDVRVVVMAQVVARLSRLGRSDIAGSAFESAESLADDTIGALHAKLDNRITSHRQSERDPIGATEKTT